MNLPVTTYRLFNATLLTNRIKWKAMVINICPQWRIPVHSVVQDQRIAKNHHACKTWNWLHILSMLSYAFGWPLIMLFLRNQEIPIWTAFIKSCSVNDVRKANHPLLLAIRLLHRIGRDYESVCITNTLGEQTKIFQPLPNCSIVNRIGKTPQVASRYHVVWWWWWLLTNSLKSLAPYRVCV